MIFRPDGDDIDELFPSEGDATNVKITYPKDLEIAERVLADREQTS